MSFEARTERMGTATVAGAFDIASEGPAAAALEAAIGGVRDPAELAQ